MIILIEAIIAVSLFTIIAIPATLRHPLEALSDYPPEIVKRCVELGIVPERERRFSKSDLIRKGLAVVVFVLLFSFILKKVNKAQSFLDGFVISYTLWLIITWYDALIVDCLWFCHSKKVRIPGTEDMKEYQDYGFHIKQSMIGTLIGLPACLLIGLVVSII
ncbi:MAG: hypothetical protein J6S49_03695, partial [Erysipelotrichaceae bacterium]|nr:hypothetical protein [Erysipelotrichaceae bacterium]